MSILEKIIYIYLIPYESHLIQIDFKYNLKEKSFLNPYSFDFSFELRKCIAYEKAIWTHQKICFFWKIQKI